MKDLLRYRWSLVQNQITEKLGSKERKFTFELIN
jgi:hypothetical protein